jgi:hypothetical protein
MGLLRLFMLGGRGAGAGSFEGGGGTGSRRPVSDDVGGVGEG